MSEQRLFISYASEDEAVATRILTYLETNGVPCWIASRDIPPRAIYADAIVEGMRSCDACAVLVSAASNESKAVKRELELASHEDKPFIPIRIDGSEPAAGMAYYLRNVQWIDYGRDGEAALARLAGQNLGSSSEAVRQTRRRRPTRLNLALLLGLPAVAVVLALILFQAMRSPREEVRQAPVVFVSMPDCNGRQEDGGYGGEVFISFFLYADRELPMAEHLQASGVRIGARCWLRSRASRNDGVYFHSTSIGYFRSRAAAEEACRTLTTKMGAESCAPGETV